MTPADHANTVREALKWTPDGYDQVDLGHEGPLRREALAALDALQAQAEEAQENADGSQFLRSLADASSDNWRARAEAAEAERDHERRRHAQAVEAFTKRDRECLAAEAERDRLREALRQIAEYFASEYREGDKAYQAVIIARDASPGRTHDRIRPRTHLHPVDRPAGVRHIHRIPPMRLDTIVDFICIAAMIIIVVAFAVWGFTGGFFQ